MVKYCCLHALQTFTQIQNEWGNYEYIKRRTFKSRFRWPCHFKGCHFPPVKRRTCRIRRCQWRGKIHFYEHHYRESSTGWGQNRMGQKHPCRLSWPACRPRKRPDHLWCVKKCFFQSLFTRRKNESHLRQYGWCHAGRAWCHDDRTWWNPGYLRLPWFLYYRYKNRGSGARTRSDRYRSGTWCHGTLRWTAN